MREQNKRKAAAKRLDQQPVTQQQVLEAMLKDTRREVADAQRDRVACWNGLGGVAILMGKLAEAGASASSALAVAQVPSGSDLRGAAALHACRFAVAWYQKTLTLAREQLAKANDFSTRVPGAKKGTGPVKVDPLQELHAARNLVHCYHVMERERRAAGGSLTDGDADGAVDGAVDAGDATPTADLSESPEVAALEERAAALTHAFMVDYSVKLRSVMCTLGSTMSKASTMLPGDPVKVQVSPHTQTSVLQRTLAPIVDATKDRFQWLLEFAQQAFDWALGSSSVAEQVCV